MKTTIIATTMAFASLCLPTLAVPLALAGAEPKESVAWNLIATEMIVDTNTTSTSTSTSLEKRAGVAYWTAYSGNYCENDSAGTRLGPIDQGKAICTKTSGRHSFLAESYGCPKGVFVIAYDGLGCTGNTFSGYAPSQRCANVDTGRAWNSASIGCY